MTPFLFFTFLFIYALEFTIRLFVRFFACFTFGSASSAISTLGNINRAMISKIKITITYVQKNVNSTTMISMSFDFNGT